MKRQTRNWNKNLKALQDINPELATKLIELKEECDWIIPIKSQNGNLNILVKRGGGEFLPGYSMENPSKEGDDAAKTMLLYKQNISVVVGMGVGYLVNSILKKSEKEHRIVVVEPVLPMVKIALHNFDFFNAIMKKELIIVTSADQVVLVLQILAGQLMIEGWNMTTDKYTTNRPEEYNKLITITAESLNQILCNTGTIAGAAGGIIADNDISCLPYVIRHRGVEELKGLFRDKPAILVSTGPSLSRNIHHLIDIKDRVIIIAVGQALRVLLAYNIRPDFISTVDFGEVNIGHFKGLMGSGVPLTTINRTYAPLLKEWQGPKFIAATPVPGFEEMASGILTKKGFIEAGGSVAHMCLGLAQLLECNPVIFIGQDLALGENSHIPLADAMGKVGITEDGQIIWKVEDHRCTLHGEKAHSMGPVHTVPGYWGKPVLTNLGLASFLTVFEELIRRHTEVNKNS